MSGVVAAGHEQTANAGRQILQLGGNAFDGAVAAMLAACVVEPTLTSLGGGGFLLAHQANEQVKQRNLLFDFFTQTPRCRDLSSPLDFYPIEANFGDMVQEFHVGLGSMAVPGMLAGILAVHGQLGRLPLKVVAEPAVACAREGVTVSGFQSYCYELLSPILMATPAARAIYAPTGQRLQTGQTLRMSEFADTLEYLAALDDEGARRTFYEGEIAQKVVQACSEGGGYLSLADFREYEVKVRSPLALNYRNAQIITNPLPSAGGSLIAFCLELLNRFDVGQMAFGSAEHLTLLSQAMRWTNEARRSHLDSALFDLADPADPTDPDLADAFMAADLIDKYAQPLQEICAKGINRWGSTTHISVIDTEGNAASVTTSNGEGSAYVIPGTQIMINNMLGEEDLNPHGFNQWPVNQRMSSMMAPTMILKAGKPQLVLGSGGSNRIRTAILQVISNVLDFEMSLTAAVEAPRIHWENGLFHLEPGLDLGLEAQLPNGLEAAQLATEQVVQWQQSNMFFGGVHSVGVTADGALQGAGDPRRSGAVAL